MKVKRELWLSSTVIFCFLSMAFVPACVYEWLAVAHWKREAVEVGRRRRIREDLRIPITIMCFGSLTLGWYSYRRYQHTLRDSS